MTGRTPFQTLRDQMSSEQRANAEAKTTALREEAARTETSRQILGLGDLVESDIEAIRNAKVSDYYAYLNAELKDWKP